ncbi:MAG TPA: prenyltransferase/squalene oxidase repeat-containing protein [Acidimicrobiales bacterium]
MPRLTEQMDQSTAWLREQQDVATGGWSGAPGDPHLSALNTAEAVIALMQVEGEIVRDGAVDAGIGYLRSQQAAHGDDAGAWCRTIEVPDGAPVNHPDVVRTGLALVAFTMAGVPVTDNAVANALGWLQRVRNADGGWGCTPHERSRILPTCQVLLGLLALPAGDPDTDAAIRAGIGFLLERCRRPGGWFSLTEFPDQLSSPHTIYAVLVLQAARRAGIQSDIAPERSAIDWLLAHQDEARRLVIEELDSAPRPHRYTFLYVTDSLLVQVLGSSANAKDRQALLYRAALFSVKDRIEPTHGACYGFRPFTWSTARALAAMSTAAVYEGGFPERPPETHAAKARGPLTAVLGVMLVLGAILGFTGSFSASEFGFFTLLVLALLLVYGFIGEKTFADLVPSVLGAKLSAGGAAADQGAAGQ